MDKMHKELFGDDRDRYLDFSNLSSGHTKRLNEIAREIKAPYTRFVDECCKQYGDNYLFWGTPFACRNIYNDSDTFLSICRLFLAKELVEKNAIDCIRTINRAERETLQIALPSTVKIEDSGDFGAKRLLRKRIEFIRIFLRFTMRELSFIACTKKKSILKNDPVSIVVLPGLSSCFEGFFFVDRYFTGITSYKKNVLFLPYIENDASISNREFIHKIENCTNYEFLNNYQFSSVLDLFEIFKYWRCVNRCCRDSYKFDNIDITPIIRRCLFEGKKNNTTFKGLLMRTRLQKLSRYAGINIDSFLIWYEGRPVDVLIASAVREFFPNVNCIGYEGYPITEINPSICVSEYQYVSRHSPTKMAIPGKAYEPLAFAFCKDIPLVHTPILRNEYTIGRNHREVKKCKTILVVLSYSIKASREMLQYLVDYLEREPVSYKLLLKNHPNHKDYSLSDYGIKEGGILSPKFVSGTLVEALKEADIAVTTITSSTLEVIFARVPLIIMCPNGELCFTALPPGLFDDLYRVVYGEEIVDAISELLCVDRLDLDNSSVEKILVKKNNDTVNRVFSQYIE